MASGQIAALGLSPENEFIKRDYGECVNDDIRGTIAGCENVHTAEDLDLKQLKRTTTEAEEAAATATIKIAVDFDDERIRKSKSRKH